MKAKILTVFLLVVFIKLTMAPKPYNPNPVNPNPVLVVPANPNPVNPNPVNPNGPKLVNPEVFVNPDTIMFMNEVSFSDSDEVYTDLTMLERGHVIVTESPGKIKQLIKKANKREERLKS